MDTWSTVEGVVTEKTRYTHAFPSQYKGTTSRYVHVYSFSYRVDGRNYSSTKATAGELTKVVFDRLPEKGELVQVYFDPNDPQDAVVFKSQSLILEYWEFQLGVLLFLGLTVGFAIELAMRRRK